MHERLLSEAALPAPTVVLGLLMRPYSLGHELFLIREQNPVSFDPKVARFSDLAQAALICCQTWDECRRMPFDKLIGLKLFIWKLRSRKFKKRFETELRAFQDYRETGCLELPLSDVTTPGRTTPRASGSPFILRLHQFVMDRMCLTESQAWDYPLGLANMRWACHWEGEGRLDVYNHGDASFDAYVAEERAKDSGEEGAAPCQA